MIPANSTIVCIIIIMTILEKCKPMQTRGIYNLEKQATLDTRRRAKTNVKIKELHKNHSAKDKKNVEKERPHQDTLGYSNPCVLFIECWSYYSFSPVKVLSVKRKTNRQYANSWLGFGLAHKLQPISLL